MFFAWIFGHVCKPQCVCVCVCGVAENPATKTFFCCSRGVQHLWHTARNEAIAKGGKGVQTWTPVPASVILKVLLAPWLRRCLCFLFFRVTCSLLEGSREHREQNPVETHQLYSRLISCTRKISTLHLEFKCVHPIRGESSGVPIV